MNQRILMAGWRDAPPCKGCGARGYTNGKESAYVCGGDGDRCALGDFTQGKRLIPAVNVYKWIDSWEDR